MTTKDFKKLIIKKEDLIPIISNKWLKLSLDTNPINKEKVTGIINELYEKCNLRPPHVIWGYSPMDIRNIISILKRGLINFKGRERYANIQFNDNRLKIFNEFNSYNLSFRQIKDKTNIYFLNDLYLYYIFENIISKNIDNKPDDDNNPLYCKVNPCDYHVISNSFININIFRGGYQLGIIDNMDF